MCGPELRLLSDIPRLGEAAGLNSDEVAVRRVGTHQTAHRVHANKCDDLQRAVRRHQASRHAGTCCEEECQGHKHCTRNSPPAAGRIPEARVTILGVPQKAISGCSVAAANHSDLAGGAWLEQLGGQVQCGPGGGVSVGRPSNLEG
ncbi:hypothetical protein CYMTET_48884 [Cymbomonas tetramitiformis]|uniref:Uncharacterized protein n=1 Tax=Cymbomonas tetramitiformis TaxID=36881 RepID=A0AAE0EUG3_9CHLO|nr:hypothetical protein CYMTET_48884 [Cymbomonas tetramitiformis]